MGKNENYASVVYRAKISIELIESKERKFVHVFMKVLLKNQQLFEGAVLLTT
jgi:hypothetical protein